MKIDGLGRVGRLRSPHPRYTPSLTIDRLREFPVPQLNPEEWERISAAINDFNDPPIGEELDFPLEPV